VSVTETVWNILNTPAAITAIAGVVLWVLNRLYVAKPAWAKYEGSIIGAIKYAERITINKGGVNKSPEKLNTALQYIIDVHKKVTGQRASKKLEASLIEGIQIIHDELEQTGTIKDVAK